MLWNCSFPKGAKIYPHRRHHSTTNMETEVVPSAVVDDIIRRIRIGFHKGRVRPLDYFKGFDKSNCGHCTDSQFVRALSSACASPDTAHISQKEMQMLVTAYRCSSCAHRFSLSQKFVTCSNMSEVVFKSAQDSVFLIAIDP